MVDETVMKKNAALVVEICQPLCDFTFGYDEQSVAWLEGYLERMRERGAFVQKLDRHVGVWGSYLGEAIIATYGGQWNEDDQPLHVLLNGNNKAFPFRKVRKQLTDGLEGGESILGFFRCIPALLAGATLRKS